MTRAIVVGGLLVLAGAANVVAWYAWFGLGIVGGMMQTQAQANAVMGW